MTSPPIVVLVGTQDLVNIASVVRVAKNFGIDRIRLVRPEVFDPYRIEGIAHNTADLVGRIEILDSLEAALADCVYSVALTARQRTQKRLTLRPNAAAAELVAEGQHGAAAIVAGREDKGLTNEELDHCHALVAIPTNPEYRSLNLAQAVAIMCYESWVARGGGHLPLKPPRREAEPASSEQLERLFADWERALWAIDFFKTRQADRILRSWREILYRARLDGREAALVRAMGIEVVRYLERAGLEVRQPPATPAPQSDAPPDAPPADPASA